LFTLAHISDVHLGPLPEGAAFRNFRLKRIVGYLSWQLRRRKLHDPAVADLVARDMLAARPDHIAVTGDIVNISAFGEFPRAARWIKGLGTARNVSFVPGNHDCYVRTPWAPCLAYLAPWMQGEMNLAETQRTAQIDTPFPFVRLRRNVALIGLSTALPQGLRWAGGTLGPEQLTCLRFLLRDLRERGYARVLMIHHPPLPGLASERKALTDAAELQLVIEDEGAELLIHGHNHRAMVNELATRYGTAHVIGVPSASMRAVPDHAPAGWHLYRIHRQDGRWAIDVTARGLQPGGGLATISQFGLVT
jgi:3',5'-cyclic AMP phosphodiesterase CpdA